MNRLLDYLYNDDEKIVDITSIDYWRQVFYAAATVAVVIGGFIMILLAPGLINGDHRLRNTVILVLLYLLSSLIITNKRFPKYFRYIFLVTMIYGVGLFMLFIFYSHLIGDMLLLLAFVIAAFVLSAEDLRALMIVNVFVLMAMSVLYEVDLLPSIPNFVKAYHWYYFIATMLIVTMVIVILISILLNGLESMISEMKISELRMKAIFDTMPSGLIMLDKEGYITDANTFLQNKVNLRKSQVVNKHINQVAYQLTKDSKKPLMYFFEHLLEGDANYEIYVEDERGHIYFSCHMTRLSNQEENLVEYVVIIHDVTEIRDAASGLVHSSKMEAIGTIAGGIAHDFNNMLGGILGYAQLNQAFIEDGQVQSHNYNQKIIDTALKASSLTKQLLTYARKEEIVLQAFDVNASLRNLISLMDRTFEKRIEIEAVLSPKCSIIEGDVSMLENALFNIGINAKDAMELGDRLVVRSEVLFLDRNYCSSSNFDLTVGDYVVISFEDEGKGMSQEVTKRIFEPFYTTKEVGKGTGLGLSTAYGAVVAHKGEIKVNSTLSIGTTIEVLLPLSERSKPEVAIEVIDEQASEEAVGTPLDQVQKKGRILIVDDEEVIRAMLVEMVKIIGYEPIVAEDGITAIEIILAAPMSFDGVFLDMIMPNANGKDVLKTIRQVRSDVPVAIISGYMKDEKMDSLYNEGADVILSKPFSLQQVTDVLDAWAVGSD